MAKSQPESVNVATSSTTTAVGNFTANATGKFGVHLVLEHEFVGEAHLLLGEVGGARGIEVGSEYEQRKRAEHFAERRVIEPDAVLAGLQVAIARGKMQPFVVDLRFLHRGGHLDGEQHAQKQTDDPPEASWPRKPCLEPLHRVHLRPVHSLSLPQRLQSM